MNRYYAGIGGRNTPENVLMAMVHEAGQLAETGYILRSGGASGADSAFEIGVDTYKENYGIKKLTYKEIYLPWKNFNNNKSELYLPWNIEQKFLDIIEYVNPSLLSCKHSIISLHARNCQQILGKNLDSPCSFVLCWTDRDTAWCSGTMFAVRLAELNNIPVFNMFQKEWINKYTEFLDKSD